MRALVSFLLGEGFLVCSKEMMRKVSVMQKDNAAVAAAFVCLWTYPF